MDNLSYFEAVTLYGRLVKQALQGDVTEESKTQKERLKKILKAARTRPARPVKFRVNTPNDNIRDYLLQNHARDTFAYDTPKIFESFNLMLGHMVNMLQSHYN